MVLDEKFSQKYPVDARVPQLFLLYINDVPDYVICDIANSWSEPPSLFLKGRMRFFKNGCYGGDGKVLLKWRRGEPGMEA